MTSLHSTRSAARRIARRSVVLGAAGLVSGCGIFDDWFGGDNKIPLSGKREDVLAAEHGIAPDNGFTTSVTLPPISANADWPQAGGNPLHLMGNLAAGGISRAWSTSIGRGAGYRNKITVEPVVAHGRIFTMDPDAVVSAFDIRNGDRIWDAETRAEKDRSTNVGGGIAFDADTLYAVNGLAEIVAFDPATGKVRWRNSLEQPGRGSPTIVDDRMFIPTADNRLVALSKKDGSRLWSYQSQNSATNVLGQGSPAVSDGIVVAGFGSGDLVALRADSGTVVWADSLAATGGPDSLEDLSEVRGLPVIDSGQVYAISLGGLLVAVDLHSGRRLWERNVASGQTPWAAGDWLFVVSASQQVAAIARADGRVRWLVNLPRYQNPKKQQDPIYWSGPLLANGKLVVGATTGQIAALDPANGSVVAQEQLADDAVSVSMIAASGMIFAITDNGELHALR